MYKRWPRYFVVCITLQASKEQFSSCFQGKKLHQVHILLEVKKGPKGKKYLQIPCQMFSVFWGYKRLAAFCTMYISAHNCVLCHQVPTYLVVVHNNIRDSPLSLLSGMPKNLLFRRNKTYVQCTYLKDEYFGSKFEEKFMLDYNSPCSAVDSALDF